MYFTKDTIDPISNTVVRVVFTNVTENSYTSFLLTDDNPNTAAYLAWVAEGNEATEWNPNGNQ